MEQKSRVALGFFGSVAVIALLLRAVWTIFPQWKPQPSTIAGSLTLDDIVSTTDAPDPFANLNLATTNQTKPSIVSLTTNTTSVLSAATTETSTEQLFIHYVTANNQLYKTWLTGDAIYIQLYTDRTTASGDPQILFSGVPYVLGQLPQWQTVTTEHYWVVGYLDVLEDSTITLHLRSFNLTDWSAVGDWTTGQATKHVLFTATDEAVYTVGQSAQQTQLAVFNQLGAAQQARVLPTEDIFALYADPAGHVVLISQADSVILLHSLSTESLTDQTLVQFVPDTFTVTNWQQFVPTSDYLVFLGQTAPGEFILWPIAENLTQSYPTLTLTQPGQQSQLFTQNKAIGLSTVSSQVIIEQGQPVTTFKNTLEWIELSSIATD